jgi:hypothetical protein
MGFVYVFNVSPQNVRLSINDPQQSGPQIPAVSPRSPKPYTPFAVQVARKDFRTGANIFINGQTNSVTIQNENGQARPADLNIPGADNSTGDLWLYLFLTLMILLDAKGKFVAQVPIVWNSDQVNIEIRA